MELIRIIENFSTVIINIISINCAYPVISQTVSRIERERNMESVLFLLI